MIPVVVKENDKWEKKRGLIIKEGLMYSKLNNIEGLIKLIIKIMKKRDS